MLKVKLHLEDSWDPILFECEEVGFRVDLEDNKYIMFFINKEAVFTYLISDISFLHIIEKEEKDER